MKRFTTAILTLAACMAPYWYVRHGMDDRDNSFAVEAALFYAVKGSHLSGYRETLINRDHSSGNGGARGRWPF